MWKVYHNSKHCRDYFGVWAAMVLNISFPAYAHKDEHDYERGYCWVLYYSDQDTFDGGALVLPELGIRALVQPGDVVLFPSKLYTHFVEDFYNARLSQVIQLINIT
jgi:hypothetical protein